MKITKGLFTQSIEFTPEELEKLGYSKIRLGREITNMLYWGIMKILKVKLTDK